MRLDMDSAFAPPVPTVRIDHQIDFARDSDCIRQAAVSVPHTRLGRLRVQVFSVTCFEMSCPLQGGTAQVSSLEGRTRTVLRFPAGED